MTRTMNKAEQRALKALWLRVEYPERPSYRLFRKRTIYSTISGCWFVPLWGMIIGIESDGYTHS
jgi:hypothetical protein